MRNLLRNAFAGRRDQTPAATSEVQAQVGSPSLEPLAYVTYNQRSLSDWVDVFRCYFTLNGQIHSVHRSFVLLPPEGYSKGKLQESENTLTLYEQVEGKLRIKSQRPLGHGTDPRVVSDGNTAYIFQLMRRDGEEEKSFYRVLKLPENSSFDIETVPGLPLGKNWQPFLRDGKLFVVFGFDPLIVLEIFEDGRVEVVTTAKTQLDIFPPHQKFSMFRGGSNGVLADDGCIYGFGHSTIRNFRHDVFMWRLDPEWNLDLKLSANTLELNEAGFLITDPTSLFAHDGAIFLGLALSERDWYFEQKFADVLVKIPGCTLPEIFAKSGPVLPSLDLKDTGNITLSIPPGLCSSEIGQATPNGQLRVKKGRAGLVLNRCRLDWTKKGQSLQRVKLYFTCSDVSDASSLEATLWDANDTCLENWIITERGKSSFSLDLSHLNLSHNTNLDLRLYSKGVELALENIRAFYTVSESENRNAVSGVTSTGAETHHE